MKRRYDWQLDHAASGDRDRAFIDAAHGGGEIRVYHTGEWEVCVPGRYQVAAVGTEPSLAAGKRRAIIVHRALTRSAP